MYYLIEADVCNVNWNTMIENVLLRPIKEVVPDLCAVPTLGVAYLNVWGWTTQGDCDLL